MKKIKSIVIIVLCVLLICGGFFFFMQEDEKSETELTEAQKIITKDLENDYPKTPREVVKLYNRIVKCYYGTDLENKELKDLSLQMRKLLDEELLLLEANSEENYYNSVLSEVIYYKQNEMYIIEANVCASNEVKEITDKEKGQNLAEVAVSYFIKTGEKDFLKTYQDFVLREDKDGKWKILHWKEGEAWNE